MRRALVAVFLAASVFLIVDRTRAQESRGAISGRVTDASGGVLPGAGVTAVNLETNSTTAVVANATGQYALLYLNPGLYRVTVEIQGFRKAAADNLTVRVGDKLNLDFRLEPQAATEEIEVVATPALLESGSATTGQVIDSKLISEIPMGDGTAYGLTRLIAGASFERSYALQRPMDNDNLRGITVSGTIS